MSDEQPEVLKLLEKFDAIAWFSRKRDMWSIAAAAELRRLHEVNQELVEALEGLIEYAEGHDDFYCEKERAVLAKAKGETE